MEKNPKVIMSVLDEWVARQGNGSYYHQYNEHNLSIGKDSIGVIFDEPGIQQVRQEIEEFVELLCKKPETKWALEIGLGRYGSTHFLWRQIFDKVVTIEKHFERIREFGRSTRDFHGKWVLDDGKSFLLDGMSNDASVVANVYKIMHEGVDLLFIDGDHSYQGVLTDWLLYSPLVIPGGVIAFHDSISSVFTQVPEFLLDLSNGDIDGTSRHIHQIKQSDMCGIGYYVK